MLPEYEERVFRFVLENVKTPVFLRLIMVFLGKTRGYSETLKEKERSKEKE